MDESKDLAGFIDNWNKRNVKRVKQNSQQAKIEEDATKLLQKVIRMRVWQRKLQSIYKMHRHRTMVVKEILSTEKTYVHILNSLSKVIFLNIDFVDARKVITSSRIFFLEPLNENKLLSDQEIKIIFSNIMTIRTLNATLLSDLEKRIENWNINQKFADIFLEFTDYFLVYLDYVKEYNTAVSNLMECLEKDKVSKFFKSQMLLVEKYENDSILSLLITPVQRIPRYNLLLQDVLKNTWSFHPDYSTLQQALEKIKTIASTVNAKAKEAEEFGKIYSIQNSLQGKSENIIKTGRKLIREGDIFLYNGERKKNSPVYTYLFNDLLVVCKRHSESRRKTMTKLDFVAQMPLFDAIVIIYKDDENANRKNCFSVETRHNKLFFSLPTNAEKQEWINDVNGMILETNEKHLFYEEKKVDVAKQKAEEARALITEKYTQIRVRGMDDSSEKIVPSSDNQNMRKFAHQKKYLHNSPSEKIERIDSAQQMTEELLKEEQELLEMKQKNAEKRAEDFKEMTKNRYKKDDTMENDKSRSWSLKRDEAKKRMAELQAEEDKVDKAKELISQQYSKNANDANNSHQSENNNNKDYKMRSWSLKRKEAQKQLEELEKIEADAEDKVGRAKEILSKKYADGSLTSENTKDLRIRSWSLKKKEAEKQMEELGYSVSPKGRPKLSPAPDDNKESSDSPFAGKDKGSKKLCNSNTLNSSYTMNSPKPENKEGNLRSWAVKAKKINRESLH